MKIQSARNYTLFTLILTALAAAGCQSQPPAPAPEVSAVATANVTVSPDVPADVPGGAPAATLTAAAEFAWQQFIALNWPAQTGNRDAADTTKLFGQPAGNGYDGTVVWHTYRHKVEIYPGYGQPNGYVATAPDYGYNSPPQYTYGTAQQPLTINACPGQGPPVLGHPAWVNLDEQTQIGFDQMYAGIVAGDSLNSEILFLAKANKTEYAYVAANKWWSHDSSQNVIASTKTYVATNKKDPPAGSAQYVSFPNGTIEIKTAWRPLSPSEDPKRYQTAPIRFYETDAAGNPCWREATWAMLALHIIHKTPTAPYFVYATFGQADNIRTPDGLCVEDTDGNVLNPPRDCYTGTPGSNPLPVEPLNPNITITPASANSEEVYIVNPNQACSPGQNLFYKNSNQSGINLPLPGEPICVQKRIHPIPAEVVTVNAAAHSAISGYNSSNGLASSPWLYYKLVNVQSVPYDKAPGTIYTGPPPAGSGPDPSTYYQANIVVETDYNLQVFSGRIANDFTITDYTSAANGSPFHNVYWASDPSAAGKGFNMGGCMGCHGNAQFGGTGFSFIFGGNNKHPETRGDAASSAARVENYRAILGLR